MGVIVINPSWNILTLINPHASQLIPINPIDRGTIYKSFTTVTIIDYPPVVKDGNWKSTSSGGSNGKIKQLWDTFHCHLWVPEGNYSWIMMNYHWLGFIITLIIINSYDSSIMTILFNYSSLPIIDDLLSINDYYYSLLIVTIHQLLS